MSATPGTVEATRQLLARGGYIADKALATTVHRALSMDRPLFLEGEPGTGKTEIAKVLAEQLPRRLVRLQCYDGLSAHHALYEWDYARQILAIRMARYLLHPFFFRMCCQLLDALRGSRRIKVGPVPYGRRVAVLHDHVCRRVSLSLRPQLHIGYSIRHGVLITGVLESTMLRLLSN